MRTSLLALTAAVLLAPAGRAQDDAKAIVDKAIKAHGGAETLDKYKAAKAKVKGTLLIMGQEVQVSGDVWSMYPSKGKAVLSLDVQGQKVALTQVIDGERVEINLNGQKLPLPDEQAAAARMSQYVSSLSQLTPLLRDQAFTLKGLGESKLEGKTILGVSVTNKDPKLKEVKLFFDKDSGLLIKTDYLGTDETGKEVPTEQIFADFKEFKGLKLPTKETILKDGKKEQEVATESIEPLEKLDDKTFTLED